MLSPCNRKKKLLNNSITVTEPEAIILSFISIKFSDSKDRTFCTVCHCNRVLFLFSYPMVPFHLGDIVFCSRRLVYHFLILNCWFLSYSPYHHGVFPLYPSSIVYYPNLGLSCVLFHFFSPYIIIWLITYSIINECRSEIAIYLQRVLIF